MPQITAEWDSRDLQFWRGGRFKSAIARALKKAGGDAVRAMRTASSRAIRERKNIKQSAIKKAMSLKFPRGGNVDAMEWRLNVVGKPAPVIGFPARQAKRGVSVSINRGQRKVIKSAFIAVMRNGHRGVFVRMGKNRLPIKELFTSRITDVFEDKGMTDQVFERGQTVFKSAFARLIDVELAKGR